MTGVEDFSEDRYEGGLLYLQNWAIGSESIEQVGYALLARIRGEEELAVGDSPGHQIEPAEFVLAQTMLSIPMLFGWDAWYVAKNRSLSAAISHDGFVDLFSPSEHQTEDLRHRLDGQSVQTFIKE